jgi:ribose transport system substrate-binding protein
MKTFKILRRSTMASAISLAAVSAVFADTTVPIDVGDGTTINLPSDRPLKVAFFIEGTNNSAMQATLDGAVKTAAQFGWKMDVFDAKWDAIVQTNQMQNALSRGYDAWFLRAAEGSTVCNIATEQAVSNNILVVTGTLPICGRSVNEGDEQWAPGTLSYVGGTQSGDAWVELLENMAKENPGPRKVGVVTGPELNPITRNFEIGLGRFLKKHPEIQIVAKARTDYSTPVAYEKSIPMIQAHPDISLYFSSYGNLTKGLVTALKELDRLKSVKVYEGGATKWSKQAILGGELQSSSMLTVRTNSVKALEALRDAQQGKPVQHFIANDGLPITKGKLLQILDTSNVSQFEPEAE